MMFRHAVGNASFLAGESRVARVRCDEVASVPLGDRAYPHINKDAEANNENQTLTIRVNIFESQSHDENSKRTHVRGSDS